METDPDYVTTLEVTIEQLIQERDSLNAKCQALVIENQIQAHQLESLREKLKLPTNSTDVTSTSLSEQFPSSIKSASIEVCNNQKAKSFPASPLENTFVMSPSSHDVHILHASTSHSIFPTQTPLSTSITNSEVLNAYDIGFSEEFVNRSAERLAAAEEFHRSIEKLDFSSSPDLGSIVEMFNKNTIPIDQVEGCILSTTLEEKVSDCKEPVPEDRSDINIVSAGSNNGAIPIIKTLSISEDQSNTEIIPVELNNVAIPIMNGPSISDNQSNINNLPVESINATIPIINQLNQLEVHTAPDKATAQSKEFTEVLIAKPTMKAFKEQRAILKQSGNITSPTAVSAESLNDEKNSTSLFDILRETRTPVKSPKIGILHALRLTKNYEISVLSSCIKYTEKMKELITFIISIHEKDKNKEMWRIEKTYNDFINLEISLRSKNNQVVLERIGRIPERNLFNSHSPLKNDKRKVALELYLSNCKELLDVLDPLFEFLSSNIIENTDNNMEGRKKTGVREGYLIKKGKNFGGWKIRYFVLKHGVLDSFETKDGELNGSLKLKYCLVAPFPDSNTDEIRHALIITEYKKGALISSDLPPNGIPAENKILSKYILCAENDLERDDWLSYMEAHIQKLRLLNEKLIVSTDEISAKNERKLSVLQSKESLAGSSSSKITMFKNFNDSFGSNVSSSHNENHGQSPHGPTKFLTMPSAGLNRITAFKPQAPNNELSSLEYKMAFGYRSKNLDSINRKRVDDNDRILSRPAAPSFVFAREKSAKKLSNSNDRNPMRAAFGVFKRKALDGTSKKVFGIPLTMAICIARINDAMELPAVFYRCIEYLEYKGAELEEGLYRLSGSTATVQALKEKFNLEDGDFDLVDANDIYDVHAVSGLLKLYLRELPEPLLTHELQRDFLRIMDIPDRQNKVTEIARLVTLLPSCNLALLKALSGHLNRVVHHCDKNKMTVRNISIVFSPTLNIPASVLSIFLSEYTTVFEGAPYDNPEEETTPLPVLPQNSDIPAIQEAALNVASIYMSEKTTLENTTKSARKSYIHEVDGIPALNVASIYMPEKTTLENTAKSARKSYIHDADGIRAGEYSTLNAQESTQNEMYETNNSSENPDDEEPMVIVLEDY